VGPLGRARKVRQGIRPGVRLDWSGVRVALGAVATAVLLTPHLQIAVTYRPGPARVPATYAFPAGT
jgi:hypothetical protein